MAVTKVLNIGDCGNGYHGKHLKAAIDYIKNEEKTDGGRLVGVMSKALIDLRRDDVFEHVKLRLWEIVSKNKGYKGSFTRKRNKFVKNPVLVKNPHSNIKYPYVK